MTQRATIAAVVISVVLAGAGAVLASGGSTRRPPFPYVWVLSASRRLGTWFPSSAVWVKSRHQIAVKVTSGAGIVSNQPVYVIVITGQFTDYGASPPRGGSFPTGTVASFIIDAHSHQTLDFGVGNQYPALRRLGSVHDLLPFLRALNGGRGAACPNAPPAYRPGRLGAVAYLHGHDLHVVDLSSGRNRRLATLPLPRAQLYEPPPPIAWSPDGRWIAVGNLLVTAATGQVCQPYGNTATTLSWAGPGDQLLAATSTDLTLIGVPGGDVRPILPHGFHPASVQPYDATGRYLLVVNDKSLWRYDFQTGRRTRLWTTPSIHVGPPINARFTPDGRWVLFQPDAEGSSSIAADGLPLLALPANGGKPSTLAAKVLPFPEFAQPCGPDPRQLVITTGSDRYLTDNKQIELVTLSPAGGSVGTIGVSRDATRSWLSPACSPNGRKIAATATINHGDEGHTIDSAERSIWLLTSNGTSRHLLVGKAGDGISDEQPRWSRDSRWILFIEHKARYGAPARLYLINVHTRQRRGPFATIASTSSYYGHHDWNHLAAWYQPSS